MSSEFLPCNTLNFLACHYILEEVITVYFGAYKYVCHMTNLKLKVDVK